MTEAELWKAMMDGKGIGKLQPQAFAVLTKPIVMRKWRGHGAKPEFNEVPLPAGTKVRVVMASRFGDVGITDDLTATSGYHYRTTCVESEFAGRKLQPAGLLTDIEMIKRER